MSSSFIDLTYAAGEALTAHRVVIRDSGNIAQLPNASGNVPAEVLGVTLQSQSRIGASVPVRRIGVASIIADAAIAAGEQVTISGADGSVRPVQMPFAMIEGADSDTGILVTAKRILPALHGSRIVIDGTGTSQSFSIAATPGDATITLATNGGGTVTTTLTALKAALDASTLAELFTFTLVGAGATLAAEGLAVFEGFASESPVIGVAQTDAAGEGALVEVLLTLGAN
jgi:hypothetical protein